MRLVRYLIIAALAFVPLAIVDAQSAGWLPLVKAGGGGGGCAEATAFLARNGNAHPTETTTAICGMVTDGTWAKFDALYVFATDTKAHAQLNWISTSFSPLTDLVSGSMTFTTDAGVHASTTSSGFGTNFNPITTTGTNFTQSAGVVSAGSLGSWDNAAGAGDGNQIAGVELNSGGTFYMYASTSGSTQANIWGGGPVVSATNSVAAGHYNINVSSTSAQQLYRNGSSVGSGTNTSAALNANDSNISFPGLVNSGFASQDQLLAGYIAGNLSATDVNNVCKRLNTYFLAIVPSYVSVGC